MFLCYKIVQYFDKSEEKSKRLIVFFMFTCEKIHVICDIFTLYVKMLINGLTCVSTFV
jgi:hypothetical protein